MMTRRNELRLLLLCPLLLLAMVIRADGIRFQHISSQKGLPHQQVEAIAQDGNGYIWFGTRNGLARYDGYGMRTFFHDYGNPHSLRHNFIKDLFIDSKHRLWIGTEEGISRYRCTTNDFVNYDYPDRQIPCITETTSGRIIAAGADVYVYDEENDRFNAIPSIGEGFNLAVASDKKGRVFVATNNSIYYYDKDMKRIEHLPAEYYDFLTGADGICPMLFDAYDRLWVGRNGKGVEVIDLKTKQMRVYEPQMLSNGTVRVIREDALHNIWLGTEQGVTIIRQNGQIDIIRQDLVNKDLLSDNAIYDILFDFDNNAWIGTYFGGVDLLLQNNHTFQWIVPGKEQFNLSGKVARMMAEVGQGIIWIATEDGGLNICDTQKREIQPFTAIPDIGTNIHSLYYDEQTCDMWIGTFRNSLFRYNLKTKAKKRYEIIPGFTSNSVFSFAKQRDGKLWVATTQGLRWYDDKTDSFQKMGHGFLDNHFVYTLTADAANNIWAGTTTNGFFRIEGKTGQVTEWNVTNTRNGLKDNYVTSIYVADDGLVWLGTNNNGLQTFHPQTGKFSQIEGESTLQQCTVCSIIGDSFGHIWISTSRGLFRYSSKTRALTRFTTENGLPTNQFNFSSSLRCSDGNLYFGTVDGLVYFNPRNLEGGKVDYKVFLKQLTINGKLIDAGTVDSPLEKELNSTREVTLSYEQSRSFAIDYGVIIPANNSSINYQIWVEGIHKTWQDAGNDHRFMAYNLAPGTYVLHLRANNSSENWDQCPETVLKIVVKPPFYRSTWAYLVYLILLMLVVGYIQRQYTHRMEARNQTRMALMEKEKIEELDKAKSSFFTTVSHELKTPLSLIVAPLKSIHRENIPEGERKHLDMAIHNTGKMEELINELVTFNKVESDNFPFYLQKGDPLAFIRRVTAAFQDVAREKSISFYVRCEDNGEEAWFSPFYVERILNNLLSNAFKYTKNGGEVNVNAAIKNREGDSYNYLYFEVIDNGIGIVKEEQQNIFNRFYQTPRGVSVGATGWGIGLSLVKRLVDIHKGFIGLESEVNRGSNFQVWVNVDKRAFDEKSLVSNNKTLSSIDDYHIGKVTTSFFPSAEQAEDSEDKKNAILIVEDNDELRLFLADYLSPHFRIFTARDGEEGLKRAQANDVMLIISDVMMPRMDGIEMCHRLKSDVATSHIPVILLTAKNQQQDFIEGYQSGAEAYIPKPFDPQALDLQVNNMIQLLKARQDALLTAPVVEEKEVPHLNRLDQEFIVRINAYIDQNISNGDLCVADITTEMSVSRTLLHVKMKSLFNMSIGEYINHKRIQYACRLMDEGYKVSETAYRSGFSDPNYFSKKFKKFTGKSPSEYIKEH